MPTAYVSSTFKDLQSHRQIAHVVLKRFGYQDVAMEYYVAEDERPLDRCLADVSACDLYVGIFAWRYGFVPKTNNPRKLSITELEFRRAKKDKKPMLLFVIDEEAEWPIKFVDADRSRIAALHEAAREEKIVSSFSTPDTLEARLSAALEQRGARALQARGIDVVSYARFLRRQYNVLDLDALTDPKRDELLQLKVQSVFVEQSVKEDSPPLELPKEAWDRLLARAEVHEDDLPRGITEEMLAELKSSYGSKPARPVVQVLAAPENRCSIVLGDPGSGKSTLLRYIALSLIDGSTNPRLQPALAGRMPFLVDLKTYAALRAQKRCETFFDSFDVLAKQENCPVDGQVLREHLQSGQPSVVMFDGIDEIFDPAEQEAITKQIVAFADAHPDARVIVTSRIIGYRRALLTKAGFRHFTLQDLDETQVTDFVRQWYTLTLADRAGEAEARIERIRQSFAASPSIRQLAGNPMLLTIMAIIGKHQELPRERWKLYDHAASVLVQHWDVKKHLADKQLGSDLMDEEDKKELLRRLAYAMQSGEGGLAGNYIHAQELQGVFEGYLRERYLFAPDRAKITAREMISQFRERNFILSLYGANLYGFVHRAFLEFFCADAIRVRFEKTKELSLEALRDIFDRHWRQKEWREVLRLICGMIGEEFAGEMIDHLQSLEWEETGGDNITLAVQCLGEVRRPEVLHEVGRRLTWTLFDWFAGERITGNKFEALRAAEQIGNRWPAPDAVAQWLEEAKAAGMWKVIPEMGDSVGLVACGSAKARDALVRHLTGGDRLAPFAAWALARGWPDRATADVLMKGADANDAWVARARAAIVHLRHYPDVIDWVFAVRAKHPAEGLDVCVVDYLADDPRALPAILRVASQGYWPVEVIEKLERYIDDAEVKATLQEIARSDRENEGRRKAADILLRAGIPLEPQPKRRKRRKAASGPASRSSGT